MFGFPQLFSREWVEPVAQLLDNFCISTLHSIYVSIILTRSQLTRVMEMVTDGDLEGGSRRHRCRLYRET